MLAAPSEASTIKTPFIEKWEKELEEVTGTAPYPQYLQQLHGWAGGDPEEELLAPHNTTVIPPLGYSDFIKEGLTAAGYLPRQGNLAGDGEDMSSSADPTKVPAAASGKDTARKELHNATEKRRREKINGKLTELRDAVPLAAGAGANKTSVLKATVEHIRALNNQYTQLLAMNRQLQETNQHLLNELREMHRHLWARARDSLQGPPHIMPPGLAPPPLQASPVMMSATELAMLPHGIRRFPSQPPSSSPFLCSQPQAPAAAEPPPPPAEQDAEESQ